MKIFISICIIIIIGVVLRSIHIVKYGSVDVLTKFGDHPRIVEAGFHFKDPLEEIFATVPTIDMYLDLNPREARSKDKVMFTYNGKFAFKVEPSLASTYALYEKYENDRDKNKDDDSSEVFDKNKRHLTPTEIIMANLGSSYLENMLGKLTADEAMISKEELSNDVLKKVQEDMNPRGVTVLSFKLTKFEPTQNKKLDDAMHLNYVAEQESKAKITAAKANSESLRIRSDAELYAKRQETAAKKEAEMAQINVLKEAELAGVSEGYLRALEAKLLASMASSNCDVNNKLLDSTKK